MKVNTQIKADILKTLMLESRRDARDIRSAIYSNTILLTGFSFALSSFLLEKKPSLRPAYICLLDLLIIILLWVIFCGLFKDLRNCRKVLTGQENKIRELDEHDTNDLIPFAETEGIEPAIKDTELWRIPIIITLLYIS